MAFVFVGAAPARAEWHVTPTIGLTFSGSTTFVDIDKVTSESHPVFGITGTWLSGGLLGAEAIATLTPGFFGAEPPASATPGLGQNAPVKIIDSSRMTTVMGNAVVAAPRRYTEYFLRPFASGGLGLIRVAERDIPSRGLINLKANVAGFNVGGGAIGFLTKSVGVRIDVRYYSTLHATERPAGEATGPAHLRYMVASLGLVIRSGAAPR